MRPIKFRAWDKCEEKMIYFDFSTLDIHDGNIDLTSEVGVTVESLNEQSVIDLMQYTGLKDKNGKEIYEGDIVRVATEYNMSEWNNEVKWDDECGWFEGIMQHDFEGTMRYKSEELEVIGNIHEHKELLEE